MLNKIWFWLLLIGILFGAGKGAYYAVKGELPPHIAKARADAAGDTANPPQPAQPAPPERLSAATVMQAAGEHLTNEAVKGAMGAVTLCLGLIGIMALWLGMMNIAREAGLVDALARLMKPAMRWLFPDVPDGHPGQGAMLMNMAANMLGMGNAATPFGLKAMEELQTLNKSEDTCTNAMAMFLAINTSSLTLIPITLIGIRAATGSMKVAAPLAGLIMATSVSTIVAIVVTKFLQKAPRYALPDDRTAPADPDNAKADGEE